MPDQRVEVLVDLVNKVDGAARWMARLATRAALVGGGAGALLWWLSTGARVADWWRGTAESLLVLVLCLAAPAWLANVRFALLELVGLPERLEGVAVRRADQWRSDATPRRPEGGLLGSVRSIRGIVGDYRDVVGSWAAVAQLLAPTFWLLTAVALVASPLLVLLATGLTVAHL